MIGYTFSIDPKRSIDSSSIRSLIWLILCSTDVHLHSDRSLAHSLTIRSSSLTIEDRGFINGLYLSIGNIPGINEYSKLIDGS